MSTTEVTDTLREELDELHERFAVLTDRVASLERDRDVLLAAAEAQAELNEQATAWQERHGHSPGKPGAKAGPASA